MTVPAHAHEAFRTRVDRVLAAFLDEECGRLLAIDPRLVPVTDQLRASLADGKRLRAAFCYWGWRATGQPDCPEAVRAATAMELVHAAAVVHDDIIDRSPVRRGRPTAHVALRPAVAGRAEHATALAMLVGDMLAALAGHLFVTCGLPAAYLARARHLWMRLPRELIAGECLEIFDTAGRPEVARSLQIIKLKTAGYTVEGPLQIGGALGGASSALMAAFSGYGVPLGEAYQLYDDLLGLFGDPGDTGKSRLDDIRGAKPTALMALAMDAAGPADHARLAAAFGDPDLDENGLRTVHEVIDRTGARARVELMIKERAAAAADALTTVPLPREADRALGDLATYAVTRQF